MYENILTRFGSPLTMVSDQDSHFINDVIKQLMERFLLEHQTSTTYYLQDNGQAQLTNKMITKIADQIGQWQLDGLERIPPDLTFCLSDGI